MIQVIYISLISNKSYLSPSKSMNSLSLGLQPNTLTHLALQKCKCFLFPRINLKKKSKVKVFSKRRQIDLFTFPWQ